VFLEALTSFGIGTPSARASAQQNQQQIPEDTKDNRSMFNVSSLQSSVGGWLSATAGRKPRAGARARGCEWGACIDVSPLCGGEALAHSKAEAREFRDQDLIVDEHGLHMLARGGQHTGVYSRVLESAQKASAEASDRSDTLSEASTLNQGPDSGDAAVIADFMRSSSTSSWRSTPRTLGLSGVGIRRFKNQSPRSAAHAHGLAAVGLAKLTLAEVMPDLTDFAVPKSSLAGVRQPNVSTAGKTDVKFANIQKLRTMGKGATATVWRCVDASTNNALAVKQLSLVTNEARRRMAVNEMVTMFGIDHVNIVTCHNVFYSNNAFHLVMELMEGGSLLDTLKRCYTLNAAHSMPQEALATVAVDMLRALNFLHTDLQVVHRDFKPGNILLSTSGQAKLADLGIATLPGEVQVDPRGDALSLDADCSTPAIGWIGTMTYMSPERLLGDRYSFSADLWSLGVVLVEAAIGRYPLVGGTRLEFWDLLDHVTNGACPSLLLQSEGHACASLQALASACLTKDGSARPSASDLLLSESAAPFLNKAHAPALAAWVHASLIAANDSEDGLQGLVEIEGSEAEGWL